MSGSTRLLLCRCDGWDVVPEDVRREVRAGLAASGAAFEEVGDLCGLAARGDARLGELAASADVRIAACYPRAVRWLFEAAGASLGEGVRLLNMRTQGAETILEAMLAGVARGGGAEAPAEAPVGEPEWRPWFPVIDRDRCKSCRQCLNFCVFGVYGLTDAGEVRVENPANCKTNCPACARICPEVAIIFPKYPAGPINGDAIDRLGPADSPVQVDLEALARGDVLAALRARSRAGAGEESRDEGAEGGGAPAEAKDGVCDCTRGLLEALGVTPEVLDSVMEDARSGEGAGRDESGQENVPPQADPGT